MLKPHRLRTKIQNKRRALLLTPLSVVILSFPSFILCRLWRRPTASPSDLSQYKLIKTTEIPVYHSALAADGLGGEGTDEIIYASRDIHISDNQGNEKQTRKTSLPLDRGFYIEKMLIKDVNNNGYKEISAITPFTNNVESETLMVFGKGCQLIDERPLDVLAPYGLSSEDVDNDGTREYVMGAKYQARFIKYPPWRYRT